MDYFKLALFAILILSRIDSSWSTKPKFDLKYTDSNREGMLEEMAQANVEQVFLEVQKLQRELNVVHMNTREMSTELAQLRVDNQDLKTRLNQQQAESRLQEKSLKDDKDKSAMKFERLALESSSERFESSLQISFSAYTIVQSFPYNLLNKTLVFDSEFVNDYKGYDKTTGVFTAPISGVYVFYFYIVEDGYNLFHAVLMVEDKPFAGAKADNGEQFVTGSSVVRVNKGETVRVECKADSKWPVIWNEAWLSSFSGYLLYVS